jgi:hypothetical protein
MSEKCLRDIHCKASSVNTFLSNEYEKKNTHTEELLKTMFSIGSEQKLYRELQQELCNYFLPMRHKNMVMSLMGSREKNDCADIGQQQITAIITVKIMHSYK